LDFTNFILKGVDFVEYFDLKETMNRTIKIAVKDSMEHPNLIIGLNGTIKLIKRHIEGVSYQYTNEEGHPVDDFGEVINDYTYYQDENGNPCTEDGSPLQFIVLEQNNYKVKPETEVKEEEKKEEIKEVEEKSTITQEEQEEKKESLYENELGIKVDKKKEIMNMAWVKKVKKRKEDLKPPTLPLLINTTSSFSKDFIIKVDCSDIKKEKNLIKSLMVKKTNTADELIKNVLDKLKMKMDEKGTYYLKANDTNDHFFGENLFINFEYVDQKIKDNQIIMLTIIYKLFPPN
jgi:hypothetical protein